MGAAGVVAESPFRLLGHLDLGDQPARRRIPPGELDAGGLADQAAASVAPDEILRPQRLAVGQRDVDAGVVLREAGDLEAVVDRHLQLADPAGEDALDVVLPQPEHVVVPGREVADERGPGEHRGLVFLSLRDEPIGDSALIENLDGAREQTACARAGEVLVRPALDDGDVDVRQRQLARQHQPRRTASGDHHRMFGAVGELRATVGVHLAIIASHMDSSLEVADATLGTMSHPRGSHPPRRPRSHIARSLCRRASRRGRRDPDSRSSSIHLEIRRVLRPCTRAFRAARRGVCLPSPWAAPQGGAGAERGVAV